MDVKNDLVRVATWLNGEPRLKERWREKFESCAIYCGTPTIYNMYEAKYNKDLQWLEATLKKKSTESGAKMEITP